MTTRKIIDEDINLEVDKAIIDAMLSAPPWIPGEQDKQKITVRIFVHLNIEFNKKSISVSLVNPSNN
ncbi:hypothetical protein [Pedobacter zeae]|uniref:Uncharacterized protein n=1 Tax=Pedobacter zeae TaxID=1737356 RepID=A0A7W6K9T7_9SPHI|nr:hypothetical protein [Pedobacter zeae]MBB4106876.1 hypothetical protein [Pedobacter zeae]GGH04294.1 hypothetical protein GCM10007422_19830 [Pedobacter zeae]